MVVNDHKQRQDGGYHWKQRRIHAGKILVADAKLVHRHHREDQEMSRLTQDHAD